MSPALMGGPIGQEHGFALHEPMQDFKSTLAVSSKMHLTLSHDILNAIANGGGPGKSLVALGCAGWEAGQLESKMLANSWLNVATTPDTIFDLPFKGRWQAAATALGINMSRLSPDASHA